MLKLTLKVGEYLRVGEDVKIVYTGGCQGNARILVDAPKSVNVARSTALKKHGEVDDGREYHRDLSREEKERRTRMMAEKENSRLLRQRKDCQDGRHSY